MKQIWFKRIGWFYLPVHILGLLVTLVAFVLMVAACIAVFRNGHSVADGLYEIFIYGTCNAFWWKWVADKTSD